MAGNSQPKSDTHFQSASTPRPFTPTVIEAPKDFKLNDAHFTDLEELGGVNLTDEHRTKLETLADFWLGDLSIRLSSSTEAVSTMPRQHGKGVLAGGKSVRLGPSTGIPPSALGHGNSGQRRKRVPSRPCGIATESKDNSRNGDRIEGVSAGRPRSAASIRR